MKLSKHLRSAFTVMLMLVGVTFGQTAGATTKTYTVTGGNGGSPTEFYALFSDGSSSSGQVNWTYNSTAEISFSLPGGLTLKLSNTAKQLVYSNGAIGGRGATTFTVSSSTYYIYRVRLLDSSGDVIQLDANGNAVNQGGVSECDYWNMTKSFSHTFSNGILFSKIEVSYATAIPITDAVITGLNSQYPVSNAAVTPTPTVTWHGTTLTNGTHYSLTYQNNTAAGTATVYATGKGIFSTSTSVSADYTLVWATYSVRFNKNNDAATGTMSNQAFTYSTAQALAANAFTRTGYTFAGWNTAANCSGTSYTDGQSVSNLTATNGGTVDLYAQWTQVWTGSGTQGDPYVITTTAGLDLLAKYVNGTDGYTANDFSDTYFKLGDDISYTHTTDWNNAASTENNYTAIGGRINDSNRYFRGTFDGQGHTVSGIRIYKGGATGADSYQGLFGMTRGATIRNVILADARITGKQYVGGIAGYIQKYNGNGGIVENCRVGSDVTIHAVANTAFLHGGVVGECNGGTISGCVSAATLTVADGLTGIDTYGGIVGDLNGDMSDCLAIGASVPAVEYNGAIAGIVFSGSTQTNTCYHGCTVGNAAPQSDAYTVSAGTGVTLTHAGSPDQTYPHGGIQRYGSILCYGGVLYAPADADVSLSITASTGFILEGYTASAGTISGNVLTMPAQDVTINATLTDVWNITAGNDGSSAEKAYVITTTTGLDLLAKYVNGTDGYTANDFSDTYFKLGDDISYTHITDWNNAASTENNYTAIGGRINDSNRYFCGTFDGQGHTVSGIRIYKGGATGADSYQGLFGMTRGATIRNVILADARITGKQYVGGIAGYIAQNAGNGGIVENCRVGSDVAIHAVADYAYNHGGVVGQCNNGGTIRGCVSAATLTVADGLTTINTYGGIVGNLNGNMSDCLAIGASVPAVNSIGAIAGYVNSGSTQNTYYHGCTVGNAANQSDAYTVSAGTGVTLTHAGSPDQAYPHGGIQRYGGILCYGGVLYAPAGADVSLSLNITVPTGFILEGYTASAGTISGNVLTMPAQDVTINATLTDVWNITAGNDGSSAKKAYVITTTAGLDLLAKYVNGTDGYTANDFSDTYFVLGADISYTHITDWNNAASTENNYTAIGGRINDSNRYFCGTFDGQGHTVSGIRIYKGGVTDADSYQGLFGMTRGATIRNVILADARITGKQDVGGIAGYIQKYNGNGGIVENCRVGSDVTIHAVANNATSHGGVVGRCNNGGTISGCVSAATLTVADGLTRINSYGGIVGSLIGDMSDCLAIGASVPAVTGIGAIAGYVYISYSTLTNTCYHGCTVGNAAPQSDAYTVSAGTGVTLTHAGSPDQTYPHGGIQRYGSILCYGGMLYAPADATVTLGTVTGYMLSNVTVSGTNTLEADGDGSIQIDPLTGDTISKTDDNPTPGVMRYHPISPNVIQVLEDTDGDGVPDTWVDYHLVWEDIDVDGLLEGGIDRDGDGHIDDVDGDNLTQQQPGGDTDKDPTDGIPLNPEGKDVILLHVDTDGDNDVDDDDEWVQLQKDLSTGVISPVYEEKITATDNGDGTWSFNMPDQNVIVAATVTMLPVAYIDADGTEQSCTNYTLLTTRDDIMNAMDNQYSLPGGWYVVYGNIRCDEILQFSGDAHIILADGARLDVNNKIDSNGYDLAIYGQAAGSGELTVIYWDISIYCNNICINGGTINIVSSNNYGIQTNGNVTFNGGTLSFDSYGISARNVILANSTSLKTLNITGGIYVNRISLDRTFTKGKPATLMLPFSMDVNDISGGTFYTFGGVEKENDRWVATMNAVTGSIEANTPYLVMPSATTLTFTDETWLSTTGGGGGQTADEGSHWTFKGTYDYIKWTTDTSDPDYTSGRAAEIGRVYGFAGVAKSENSIEVGDFVKVASGARIRPMSAYLMWSDTPNQAPARTGMKAAADTAHELPQSITVRLLDASGTVTNVGEIDTETGEISFEGWYTLQGVKLDAEPTEPGIYIYNGKTVSIQK